MNISIMSHFYTCLGALAEFPEYFEKLKASHLRIKMHLSITVAWFVLAFLSLSKVAQQFSEVSTSSVECPLHPYIPTSFSQTKMNLNIM